MLMNCFRQPAIRPEALVAEAKMSELLQAKHEAFLKRPKSQLSLHTM